MLRNASTLLRVIFRRPSSHLNGVRFLYTAEALSLHRYASVREKVLRQYGGQEMVDKFRARMQEMAQSGSSVHIFNDDLRDMLYLAEDAEEDVELLRTMLVGHQQQNAGFKPGDFVFGPVVMRYFYHVKKPKEAFRSIMDPNLAGIFDQHMTFQLAMDLLLKNEMYNEVIELFKLVQQRAINGDRFPKNCCILVMAALHQMNTPEGYAIMLKIVEEANASQISFVRRAVTFAASLALKQQHPEVALHILLGTKQQGYVTVRNLKLLAFSRLGRFENALSLLRSCVDTDPPESGRKRSFTIDTIGQLRGDIAGCGDGEIQQEFARMDKVLTEKGMIEGLTLDQLLSQPIESLQPNERNAWGQGEQISRRYVRAGFEHDRPTKQNSSWKYNHNKRSSLTDLE